MVYSEALELAEKLKERLFKGAFSSLEKMQIEDLYMAVLGKNVRDCNCEDRFSDALIETYNYLIKNKKMKEQCDYKLRAGVVLQIFGSSEVYTNDNLTNKVAEEYLKKFPDKTCHFEKYVEPVSEVLNQDFVNVLFEELKTMTKKAIREKHKAEEIDGVKLTARLLDRYIATADTLDGEITPDEE